MTNPLEIPYLEQNVAQPEIPENEAKDILSSASFGILYIDMVIDTAYLIKETNQDLSATYPFEWQHAILVLNSVAHTITTDLVFPELKIGKYVVHNKTSAIITATQYGVNEVDIPINTIYNIYCDGTDVWRVV